MYLCNEEINVPLQEILHLLPKDGLDLHLTPSLQIRGSLRHTSSNQCIALIGDLPGHVAGSLVDLGPLCHRREHNKHYKSHPAWPLAAETTAVQVITDSDVGDIATQLQLILAAVEGECLNHIGASPQKFSVQLPHCIIEQRLAHSSWSGAGLMTPMSDVTESVGSFNHLRGQALPFL